MMLGDEDDRQNEVRVLTQVLELFQSLTPDSRSRLLEAIATYFRLPVTGAISRPETARLQPENPQSTALSTIGTFSEDRSIPPKQFILEKQPKTDVEKVACLAYYLTHYRDTPHFKTLDISKLNTESAQVKFSNAAVAVDNATKLNYLVPATRGMKQLSAHGEQFVLALPDRDKARAAMVSARPRRRLRKLNSIEPTPETN